MDKKEPLPLMPPKALEYFIDGESDNKLYLRAISIRNCLENICETIFIYILNEEQKKDWGKKNLNAKISAISTFFSNDINSKLHGIRKLGNKGAHQSEHIELVEDELEIVLMDLSRICEWTLTAYFVKHGFTEHPWILTVFSILPQFIALGFLKRY